MGSKLQAEGMAWSCKNRIINLENCMWYARACAFSSWDNVPEDEVGNASSSSISTLDHCLLLQMNMVRKDTLFKP